MGIDFTHCEAHWSYGGFHNFRQRLWKELSKEYTLPSSEYISMDGIGGSVPWNLFPDDEPLKTFFDHSDCDGDLSPLECSAMAPRIKKLVANWPENDFDRLEAEELIEGMLLAASLGERLEFI